MPTYYSPEGNPEVWDKQPSGYITVEEHDAIILQEYNKLENIVSRKLTQIDEQTSFKILRGFNYTINDIEYHFNYDTFDQQNFSDSANIATINKLNSETSTYEKVTWNAYADWDGEQGTLTRIEFDADAFLDLYINGALKHKLTCMEEGVDRKAATLVAFSNNTPVDEIEII